MRYIMVVALLIALFGCAAGALSGCAIGHHNSVFDISSMIIADHNSTMEKTTVKQERPTTTTASDMVDVSGIPGM